MVGKKEDSCPGRPKITPRKERIRQEDDGIFAPKAKRPRERIEWKGTWKAQPGPL